jgi:hypothetical protein
MEEEATEAPGAEKEPSTAQQKYKERSCNQQVVGDEEKTGALCPLVSRRR